LISRQQVILPSRVRYFVPDYQNRTHQQARQIGPSVILPVKYCKTVKRTQISSGKGLTLYLTHLTLIHQKGKVPVDNESFTLRNKPKVQHTLCQFFLKINCLHRMPDASLVKSLFLDESA